jgi:hypothetical protein
MDALECRARAVYWYTKALNEPAGAARELQERLIHRIDSVAVQPVTVKIEIFNSDFSDLRLSNDGLDLPLTWFTVPSFRINHVRWWPEKQGSVLQNTGLTRLFPNAIDFSKLQLLDQWGSAWGQWGWQVSPSGFTILNSHSPGGSANYSYRVRIHAPFDARASTALSFAARGSTLWDAKFYKLAPAQTPDKIRTDQGWQDAMAATPVAHISLSSLLFSRTNRLAPPFPNVPIENFVMTATSDWDLPAGTYEVFCWGDDEIRVFVDDQILFTRWKEGLGSKAAQFSVKPESPIPTKLRVDLVQFGGDFGCNFFIRRVGD